MEVLLVEDDENDIETVVRLAARSRLNVQLTTATTGDEAVERLSRRQLELQTGTGQAPDVVLLDLNLPAKPGIEVLRWIKANDELCEIPVVIVSGNDDDGAIRQGLELGAHSHMRKPITLRSRVWIVTAIRNNRSRLQKLPSTSSEASNDARTQPKERLGPHR
jgi:CheY-like chemotaxis protein